MRVSVPHAVTIVSFYSYFFSWRVLTGTYDHRTMKTLLPVRSADIKHGTGGLVVRWVTTSEYPLLYVFVNLYFFLFVVKSQQNLLRFVSIL
jgi:nitrogen fixation-related uncharacterized protein